MNKNSQIIKAFKALPYIILKGKYLIPQRPFPKYYNNFSLQHKLLGSYRTKFPQMITEDFIEKLKNPDQQIELAAEYQQLRRKQKLQYLKKLQEYTQKYISPLKSVGSGVLPFLIHYNQNRQQIQKTMKQQNKKISFKQLKEIYVALSQQKKAQLFKKKEEINLKKMSIFYEAQKKYAIPFVVRTPPHIIFLRQVKDKPITPSMYKQLKKEPQSIQKIYKEKAKKYVEIQEAKFDLFLKSHNLSLQEFKYIESVCQKIAKLKKEKGKGKNLLKKQIQNDFEENEIKEIQETHFVKQDETEGPKLEQKGNNQNQSNKITQFGQTINTDSIQNQDQIIGKQLLKVSKSNSQKILDLLPKIEKQNQISQDDLDLMEEISIQDIKRKYKETLNKKDK